MASDGAASLAVFVSGLSAPRVVLRQFPALEPLTLGANSIRLPRCQSPRTDNRKRRNHMAVSTDSPDQRPAPMISATSASISIRASSTDRSP